MYRKIIVGDELMLHARDSKSYAQTTMIPASIIEHSIGAFHHRQQSMAAERIPNNPHVSPCGRNVERNHPLISRREHIDKTRSMTDRKLASI